ncbi:hypothetical protein TNCV_3251721 [Trichonephila clavipes]|nr:hypothetical protein TNCV_3251721 [Trichonephila clavipes]
MQGCYNKRSSVKNFSIGEQVVLLIPDSSNKIYARWTGPGEIIQHHPPRIHIKKLNCPMELALNSESVSDDFPMERMPGSYILEEPISSQR